MRYFLFLLLSGLLLLPFSQQVYAEAIPTSPPPVERPKTKQRLSKAYKKRLLLLLQQTQTNAGTVLATIAVALLGVAFLGAAIWGFFLFSGTGAIILLLLNVVVDLFAFGLLLYTTIKTFPFVDVLLSLVLLFFSLSLKAFSLGILLGLPALWIPGLVVLSLLVLFALVVLFLYLQNINSSAR